MYPVSSTPMQVLLTGASGYVGQHLLHRLLLDTNVHLPLRITAAYGELASFEEDCRLIDPSGSLELLNSTYFNLADATSMNYYFESRRKNNRPPFDVVIHLAAVSSPLECEKNPSKAASVNTPTTLIDELVLDMQLHHQLTQIQHKLSFIFMSTDQVYHGSKSFYDPDLDTPQPINMYGKSKLDMEHALLQIITSTKDANFSFQPIILRSSLVVGPKTFGNCRKQSFLQFIEHVIRSPRNGTLVEFYTNEFRNVIHVENVLDAICFFIQRHFNTCDESTASETPIYNMGGRDRVSRWDVLMAVTQFFGITLDEVAKFAKGTERINNGNLTSTVQSPLDISMTVDKLERCTKVHFMGLTDIVAKTWGEECLLSFQNWKDAN